MSGSLVNSPLIQPCQAGEDEHMPADFLQLWHCQNHQLRGYPRLAIFSFSRSVARHLEPRFALGVHETGRTGRRCKYVYA